MIEDKKKKTGSKKEEHHSESSCCSFSKTMEFLKKSLGEASMEPDSEVTDASCSCEDDIYSDSKPVETKPNPKKIKEYVKNRYASLVSQSNTSCCGPSISCCSPIDTNNFQIAMEDKKKCVEGLGYTEIELNNLPNDVIDISFGCGNPTAIAELQTGEIVLDLGSGGGIDVFLAAKKVGPSGKAIGLDMTPAMIDRANKNAEKIGLPNVEFKLGEIEAIPLVDKSIDVVISNCVINLSTDKAKVFRQIYRVLKPGGRLVLSDIVLNGQLPDFIKKDFEAWAGCIAGALQEEDYIQKIKDTGFINITVESKRSAKDLTYSIKKNSDIFKKIEKEADCSPEELLDRIMSIKIKAYKPQ